MFAKRKATPSRTLRDVAIGAAAGVVGTLAMSPVSNWLYSHESEEKKQREERLRPEPPFGTLAGRLLQFVGLAAMNARKQKLGQWIHWGYGISWGVSYALLRRRASILRRAGGVLFGVAFFVIGDELMNSVTGLTPPPKAFPIEAHVRGLAGHIAFTAAAEATARVADGILT